MKTTLNELYRIFLMPYLERDRYFKELCDETEKECEAIALKMLLKREGKNNSHICPPPPQTLNP